MFGGTSGEPERLVDLAFASLSAPDAAALLLRGHEVEESFRLRRTDPYENLQRQRRRELYGARISPPGYDLKVRTTGDGEL
ncbi:hypothetical protein AGIG_G24417 [Arapaima gigas]